MIPDPEHQDRTLHSLESSSWIIILDRVNLKKEDRQKDLGILVFSVFRSICKDKYSWYAQVHNTHKFYVWILVFRFWLNQYLFSWIVDQNKFNWFMYSSFILYMDA